MLKNVIIIEVEVFTFGEFKVEKHKWCYEIII
jgi:hypothetical protein